MTKPIYHITDFSNLDSIINYKGLASHNRIEANKINFQDIAYGGIQNRRHEIQVPCRIGSTLHDYIPFYFAPRSPMLGAIHKNKVPNCHRGQKAIIHLVSTIEAVVEDGLLFFFTDGHATMAITNYFYDLSDLNKIDWQIMEEKYWNDTPQDNDRMRRRQAEFLVYDFFPWTLISEIGVINEKGATWLKAKIADLKHKPLVTCRPEWYY